MNNLIHKGYKGEFNFFLYFTDVIVPVRRKCYSPSSPAGKGARWECSGAEHSQEWHPFDMDIQCLIEEAWANVSFCHI